MPLLLAAFQYRFNRDVDALARHIVDSVTLGCTPWAPISSTVPRPRSSPS
ncbi:hypothetical protein ACH4OT_21395 [Streptomyces murinus]